MDPKLAALLQRVTELLGKLRSGSVTPTPPALPAGGAAPTPIHQLDELTPAEIQEIGAKYRVNMTGIVGTTLGRVATTLLFGNGVLLAAAITVMIVTGILGIESDLVFWLLTLAIWFFVMGNTYRVYLVAVPKLTGLITTNQFTGELHTYGTGLGLKYPWERYTRDDFIDLQADVVEKKSSFVTSEGITVEYNWTAQFTPFLPMLPLYVRTENRAISEGLAEVVETTFSGSVLAFAIEEIRHPKVVELIKRNLLRVLEGKPVLDQSGNEVTSVTLTDSIGYPIEVRFAIRVELATLGAPQYEKDYRELKMGSLKADQMRVSAEKFAKPDPATGWTGMSAERAMRQMNILNNEPGVTDESFTIDLTDRAKDAVGALGAAAGPILGAMANRRRQHKGTAQKGAKP